MLVNDISAFSVYALKNTDYTTLWNEILHLSLLQIPCVIGPLFDMVLHYAEVISAIKRSFTIVVMGPGDFIWLKRKKEKG